MSQHGYIILGLKLIRKKIGCVHVMLIENIVKRVRCCNAYDEFNLYVQRYCEFCYPLFVYLAR